MCGSCVWFQKKVRHSESKKEFSAYAMLKQLQPRDFIKEKHSEKNWEQLAEKTDITVKDS